MSDLPASDRHLADPIAAAPPDVASDRPTAAVHGGERGRRGERRHGGRRRAGRAGLGRRDDDAAPAGVGAEDRRRFRTLADQRQGWVAVRRWMARHDLEDFRELVERLAQAAFGSAATAMPHLRRSRGRQYMVFVIDAACPEASTNYGAFLPMEQAFWTAYASLPKPTAPTVVVAVRPARGWCRSEALMPAYTTLQTPEEVA